MHIESAFNDQNLKAAVDNVNDGTFCSVRKMLIDTVKSSDKFGGKNKAKHLNKIAQLKNPTDLQFFFYNYLLGAEELQTITTSLSGDPIIG